MKTALILLAVVAVLGFVREAEAQVLTNYTIGSGQCEVAQVSRTRLHLILEIAFEAGGGLVV